MGRDVAELISFAFVEEALIIDELRIGAAAIRVLVRWSWDFKGDSFKPYSNNSPLSDTYKDDTNESWRIQ